MSDLTRRVLDWAAANADEHGFFYPALAMAGAAPTLARQVEAVEALADRMDEYAVELDNDGEDGYADAARTDAARIRTALNGDTP